MPTITKDVDAIEKTVTREVVLGVVYDLIAAMGIPYNTKILYPGSSSPEDLPIALQDNGGNSMYDPEVKVVISATEEYVEDATSATMLSQNENVPIFQDKALGIVISPIYAKTELKISVAYRYPDRNMAQRQLTDIRRRSSLFREGLLHELEYYYFIPQVNLVILKALFDLREKQAGYSETFTQWLGAGWNDQVRVYSNRSGEGKSIGKYEKQAGVMGHYDFTIVPDQPENTNEGGSHTLRFDYTVRYDKVMSTVMSYPLLVHNQLIPTTMFDRSMPYELGLRLQLPSNTRYLMDTYTDNAYVTPFRMGAPVPHFNDWQPVTTPTYVEGILRLMMMVNPLDLRELLDLTSLGDVTIDPDLVTYMQQEHANLPYYKACAVFVALYEDGDMLDGDNIVIDQNLVVRTTFDMDLRKQYHVFVGILTRLDMLYPSAADRLRDNATLCNQILLGIDHTLEERGLLPTTIGGTYVPKAEFQKAVQAINEKSQPVRGTATYGRFRVGQFVIAV